MTEKEFENLLRATAEELRADRSAKMKKIGRLLAEAADRLDAFGVLGAALMRDQRIGTPAAADERKPLTLRMPRVLRNKLAAIAKAEGVSLNDWVQARLEQQAGK